jgi:hypothetical protein
MVGQPGVAFKIRCSVSQARRWPLANRHPHAGEAVAREPRVGDPVGNSGPVGCGRRDLRKGRQSGPQRHRQSAGRS